jgi:hypothetical protein
MADTLGGTGKIGLVYHGADFFVTLDVRDDLRHLAARVESDLDEVFR